jgi:hypothetical protein
MGGRSGRIGDMNRRKDIDYHQRFAVLVRRICLLLIPAIVLVLLGFIDVRLAQAGVIVGFVTVLAVVFVPAVLVIYWHFTSPKDSSSVTNDAEDRGA